MICESTGQKKFAGNFPADVDLLTLQLAKLSNVAITDYWSQEGLVAILFGLCY